MENGRESAQKSCKLIYPTCTMSFHITHQIMHCISHHTTSCYIVLYYIYIHIHHTTHQITHHLIHDMVHHILNIIHPDVVITIYIIYIIATSHVIIVAAMIIV